MRLGLMVLPGGKLRDVQTGLNSNLQLVRN